MEFHYKAFEINGGTVTYRFEMNGHEFAPTWDFGREIPTTAFFRRAVFDLGMVELVSYWKACCPKDVVISCGILDDSAALFWKKLYRNGLGEFFFRNNITPSDDFIRFHSNGQTFEKACLDKKLCGNLIPVGGGKDSIVTMELLKETREHDLAYLVNLRGKAKQTAELAGFADNNIITAKRTISPELLKMNQDGALNGHTPFSAVVAFSANICAALYGKKYVVLSNESSADEGNTDGVNHQYSKSTEFEQDFREYIASYYDNAPRYFSLLRPLSEWQITKLFVKHERYFTAFLSCNLGSKADKWCCDCPKCLYIYIMLAAFLDDKKLENIFGENLLQKPTMERTLRGLLTPNEVKPFECVGTYEEINHALFLTLQHRDYIPIICKNYSGEFSPDIDDKWNGKHFIPNEFIRYFPLGMSALEQIRGFFSGKRVLVLGLGREGRSTLRILRSCDCFVGVADVNEQDVPSFVKATHFGETYLDFMQDYDIVMQSPGVALFGKDFGNICSQTELLLRFCGGNVVGVTGTKGKSTTSSMLFHILKQHGNDAFLIGNIGVPPLQRLTRFNDDSVLICELSCHQLEYACHSPHIAILLNVLEEHLDHYKDFAAYKSAKENIFRYQTADDVLIRGVGLTCGTLSRQYTCSFEENADITPEQIVGESVAVTSGAKGRHNQLNAAVAMFAAKQAADVSLDISAKYLESFVGLPHRLEELRIRDGRVFVNDSISTIPNAAIMALETFPDTDTLIVGGMDRGISYDTLIKFLTTSSVKNLVCLPNTGKIIGEPLKDVLNVRFAADMEKAVAYALEVTTSRCVLSPAAASYGFYKNFEERGEHFKSLVLDIK
ncbi:MAG: UDP-N-acetylmuramoyl-L-alanine--D-glutamate ligase [Oscillospiraceae bacterium]|jgi:UDP-N-acetylmuramoylalanine--D-glutamate ligase|nr:UDP-N-acetylmuramoyl-L-alanine--D-glutamate ligase [Oscillospiraceae bacterium]